MYLYVVISCFDIVTVNSGLYFVYLCTMDQNRDRMYMICKQSCLCRDLSTNQLSAITAPMFAQLKSLQHLKLGWNQISYITEHAFDDLAALKTL